MLRQMPDDEDEELVQGITGFQYHGNLSGSETELSGSTDKELSGSPQDKGKGKSKVIVSPKSGSPAISATRSFASQTSGNFPSFGSPAKSFMRAHARIKVELSSFPAVSEAMAPTLKARPALSGPSPSRRTRGPSVLEFGSLGIFADNATFDPVIPAQPARNPFSGPSNSFGSRFQPIRPSRLSFGGSFDSDMQPTQYNSPKGSFVSDSLPDTSLAPTQTPEPFVGGLTTQVASFDSNMPPTRGNSLAGTFTRDRTQGSSLPPTQTPGPFIGGSPTQVNTPPAATSFDSDMPPKQSNSLAGSFTINPRQVSQVKTPPRTILSDSSSISTRYNTPTASFIRNPPPQNSSLPPTQTPVPPTQAKTLPHARLSDSDMPSTQANTPTERSQSSSPGFRNGIYSNPGGAIVGFFRENVASAHDEDMPDTDGESEPGDLDGGEEG
jgi:hypothetical protein